MNLQSGVTFQLGGLRMKKFASLALIAVSLCAHALPTYEPFTEYSDLVTAGGGSVDLAASGFYLTNGVVVEQWGGGSSGFGLLFAQTGADVQVTNNPATIFTAANLAAILPAGFPGAGGDMNITAFIPQNTGSGSSGNSAVLKFAQDIPRPTSGVQTIYVSYLLDVTGNINKATGSNAGRYAGFLSQTNILEGAGTGGAYPEWTSLFNSFGASPNYVAYGEKTNSPAVAGAPGDNIVPADSSNGSGGTGAPGIKAIYNAANFVVGCFTFTAGGSISDTNTVWINPPLTDFGGPVPSTRNISTFAMGTVMSDVGAFFLESRSGGATGGIGPTFIGNLLIGTTWSYVTGGPEFTSQPGNQLIAGYGANASFTGCAAVAGQTVNYRWQKIVAGATNNFTDGTGTAGGSAVVSGSATSNLTLTHISAGDLGTYQLVATASGTAYSLASSPATLSIPTNDPTITGQPASSTANYGSAVTFSASAVTLQNSLSYQWCFGSSPLVDGPQGDGSVVNGSSGMISNSSLATTLTLSNLTYLESGTYFLWVSNNFNHAVTSSPAALTVNDPIIVAEPSPGDLLVTNGTSAEISVVAAGGGLTYQWWGVQKGELTDGGDLSGVTTSTLKMSTAQVADADTYYCMVSGASGQTLISSTVAVLVESFSGTTLQLMPFGGSIVAGQTAQIPYQGGGFRSGLFEDLLEDGRFTTTMLGSSTALLAQSPTNVNILTIANERNHEGHPGWTTLMMLANINANDGNSAGNGGYWLAPGNGVNPNHILVNIGGNDAVKYGTDVTTLTSAAHQLDAIVSEFNTLRPGVDTIVSTIGYRGDGSGTYSAGLDAYFNPAVSGIVFNHVLAGQSVRYLDLRNLINYPADIGSDLIHPTQDGYNKMADVWYQSLVYGAAYWTGHEDGNWNTPNRNQSNWAMDSAQSQDRGANLNDPATLQFGIYPDVYFNSNAGALSTTLGADTTIRSLNFTKGASGPVTIGAGNTLTIGTVDKSVTLSTPYTLMNCGGITVQAGSGAHTLAADIVLGANQTWANVSTNDFIVGGLVSGPYILTISGSFTLYQPGIYTPNPANTTYASYTTIATNYAGSGAIVLSGDNSYTGGTFVNNGTLVVDGQSAPDSGTGTGTVTITGGILSGNGRITGSVAVANASNAVIYPNIKGGGVLTLGGNLTFAGANSGAMFNLGADTNTGNDKVVLESKTLTCGGAKIIIRNTSPNGLSTSDYVLFDAGPSGTISGNFSSQPVWSGTPPPNFSQYAVLTDGHGVVLHYYPIGAGQIGITNNSAVAIKYLGIPTNSYIVEMTTNLTVPWHPVSTNQAGTDGSWRFVDTNTTSDPQRFYRLIAP
jgi:autotransporter-associated beta strand protein